MLVVCKISRLFVNTLPADYKYSLLNRDNLTQPNQILLPQKQKTFSVFLSAFLKSTLNFANFETKDDPHSRCISQINVSEKSGYINVCKIRFQTSLRQETWEPDPNTVEIWITLHLPYQLIPVKIIQLVKSLCQCYAKSQYCLLTH